MRIVDLFAGLEGWGGPHRDRHAVCSVDLDERFGSDITADVLDADLAERITEHLGGRPDLVLASPPCETFTVLTIGHHWRPGRVPATDKARLGIRLVERTRELIDELGATFYVIENPLAMLRTLAPLADLERRSVTYCRLGVPFRKPTDLWGGFPPSLELPAPCRTIPGFVVERDGVEWRVDLNGHPCHVAAPRGSRTGVQGELSVFHSASTERRDLSALRAKVPERLSRLVVEAAERDLAAGRRAVPTTLF